ncbi:MAG: hypothetical protein CVV11_18870 [Gammaproteobacteria bacterium HGW-Gammaproteobacteria-15]|nr:MAG: hypothetical protein CVV11_18870 [Gammaproteobacteria bacterium HGW-Gammaproteobacteria-15]
MSRPLILSLLLIAGATLNAQEWREGLTELQQSRTYPYVDKAFALQQQQQFSAAAAEFEKALKVVPGNTVLLNMLFDAQLAIPDTAAALQTYQRLPLSEQQDKLSRIVQTQLDNQQLLELDQYAALLHTLTPVAKQQLIQQIASHLLAEQRVQQAFDWLLIQTRLSDSLLLQRAELADQLSLPQQVITDTEALSAALLTEQDWLRYLKALISQEKYQQAARLANQHAGAAWATHFYRQWLQMQLAGADWAGAEHSFAWLAEHAGLTDPEQLQRYQSALNNQNTELAKQLIPMLKVNCLDKVVRYVQLNAEAEAKLMFLQCPVQQTSQWLTFAERWMSANELEAIAIDNPTLATQQADRVMQKRIATQDYQNMLQRKFSQPLRRQDYPQLVASINALTDTRLQLKYMEQMYQQMPDDYLLERLSYLYIEQKKPSEALNILEKALPFSTAVMTQQVLPERLLNLLQQQTSAKISAVLPMLEDWTILTVPRAELWRIAGNCQQAEQLLAPAPDSAEGWKTLALCANNQQPAAAIQYWRQAHQLQPDDVYLKQIAYQYQILQQPQRALALLAALPDSMLLAGDILTMAELALQAGNSAVAAQYLQKAEPQSSPDRARWHSIQALLHSKLNQPQLAVDNWRQAAALQPDDTYYQLAYAYALADTKPAQAIDIMLKVHSAGYQFNATEAAQLAYWHQRLGLLPPTQQWTDTALLLYSQQLMPQDSELETQFSLVRLQQQLHSPWQVSSSATLSTGAVAGERLAADSAELARHGLAMKAEYFFNPLQRDLSVYVVLAANGNDTPWQNWGQQLGISYKPAVNLNLWLTAGLQQYPLAEGDWQSLLRLSADLLNAEPWQSEWRPGQAQWWERKVYIDAVWWPESGNRLAQLRFDQGKVWKLTTLSAQTLKWFGLAQFDYRRQAVDSQQPVSGEQLAAGMGLQWRYWPGKPPVLLHSQRYEVNIEWQYQLAGDLNQRQHALLLQFYLAW